MAMGTSKPGQPKAPQAPKDTEAGESSPQSPLEPEAPVSSPRVHNLESHDLTAREQLMRQWPSWGWERRETE